MKLNNLILSSSILLALSACGGNSNQNSERNYIGAGSVWNVALDNPATGDFHITRRPSAITPIDVDFSGTYSSTPSNALDLNITTVALPTNHPIPTESYALEIPEYLFLAVFDDNIVPMVKSGSCPTTTTSWNYVTVKSQRDVNDLNNPFFGKVTYNPTLGQFTVNNRYNLTTNAQIGTSQSFSSTCNNGVISFSGKEIYVSPSGGLVGHDTTNGDIYYGLPTQSAAITASDLDGTYTGVLYDNQSGDNELVKLVCNSTSNTLCAGEKIDLQDATQSTSGTIDFTQSQPALPNGFITGTVNSDSLVCAVDDTNVNNSVKKVINCIFTNSNDFKNILLIER